MRANIYSLLALTALTTASRGLCAEPEFRPDWVATCKFGSIDFAIRFKSTSGDPTQDDHVVTLRWGSAKTENLPIGPALFLPAKFASDAKNYCRDIGAFDWPNSRLLLLIPLSGRPSNDRLIAAIIDAKTGALVQNVGEIGAHGNAVWLMKQGSGYRVLLERAWYEDATTGGEFPAPDWMQLSDERGRVVWKWETLRK